MPAITKLNSVAGVGLVLFAIGLFAGILWFVGLGIFLAILGAIFGWEDRWKCDYCDKKFKHKAECVEHEKEHLQNTQVKMLRCNHCDEEFKTKQEAAEHKKSCMVRIKDSYNNNK